MGRNEPPSACTNQKNSAMQARSSVMASATGNCGVTSSTRPAAAIVYAKANVNAANTHLNFRSVNAIAMTRGVNWALASCTTISIDDTTKTTNVNIDAVNAPRMDLAPSGVRLNQLQPMARSTHRISGATSNTANMAMAGRSHSDHRNILRS